MTQLRKERKRAGLTLKQLAQRTGLHKTTIQYSELGRIKNTTTETAERIAQALGVPVASLFFSSDMEANIIHADLTPPATPLSAPNPQ